MAEIYKFKTTEDIDDNSRTIIKEESIPATTKKTEFTLESKEQGLESLKNQATIIGGQITELETEIAKIKADLKI